MKDPDINTDAWIVPPKGDDQKYWLNKYGKRIWTQKLTDLSPELTAERSYYWVDRVLIMNENRRIINDIKFSDFIKDTSFWTPVENKS